jgi:Uma2 family endonuclease
MLVVEVANVTLRRDRTIKQRVYAAAGIPTYWIVNLIDRRVEVFSGPATAAGTTAYAEVQNFAPGEAVPLKIDGRELARIPVADLLP